MMNKKALSLMVSFVLLVGMSVALAGMVYAWLKFYVQKPFPEESCPEVSIIIYNYTCNLDSKIIVMNIQNRGLFSISGFMAKMNDKSPNEEGGGLAGRYSLVPAGKEIPMAPGNITEVSFVFPYYSTIKQIELEPFLGTYFKPILCDKAILREDIDCR